MVGQVGYMMMGIVDNIMVGRIGADYLAAASIANSIFIIFLVVGIGVSYAVTPLVAISIGSRNIKQCESLFQHSFFINLIAGTILTLIVFVSSEFIKYLNQPPIVVELAIPFLKILAISIIPIMIFQTYKQFIEGLSIIRPAMIVILLANIVNLAGNWILVYGNFGFPKLKLNGSGISTLSARIFSTIVLVCFIYTSSKLKTYNLNPLKIIKDKLLNKKLLSLGAASGFQYFFEVAAFSTAAVMVGWLGTGELAAHQIAINIASLTYMIVLGISSASAIRVGNFTGEKNIIETRNAGFTAIKLAIVFMSFCAILLILFNKILPAFYVKENYVINVTSSLLIIAALFQLFDGVQAVGIGILRGLADVKFPTLITFVAYWIVGLPLSYLLAFYFNLRVQGIWLGFAASLAVSAILLTTRFHFKSRKQINIY